MQLTSKEIEDYIGKRRDATARAYTISGEEGENVAHLFTSRETYTFAWYGSIEFNKIRSTIEARLTEYFFNDPPHYPFLPFPYPLFPRTLLVSLIIHESEVTYSTNPQEDIESQPSYPRLKQFELVNGKRPEDYLEALLQPNKISFARVDYKIGIGMWQAAPSFTAENPKSRLPGKAELAIKTPRTYRYSPDLLRFIVQTIRSAGVAEESADESQDILVTALQEQLDEIVHQRT